MTWPMCWTSRRVPWNALLAVTALSTSQMGWIPRSRAASALSTTRRRRAHAHDQAVPPAIEGSGGLFDDFICGGRSAGQEAGAKPADQMIGGDIVCRDDDHPAATSGADPVLRQADGMTGGCARGVDLRVGSAGADELGELRMSHRQGLEQEAAIEDVRVLLNLRAQILDLADDFLSQGANDRSSPPPLRPCFPARPIARGGRGPHNSAPSRRRRRRNPGRPSP